MESKKACLFVYKTIQLIYKMLIFLHSSTTNEQNYGDLLIIFGSMMSMAALPIFAILIGNEVESRRKFNVDKTPKKIVDVEKTVDTDSLDSERANSPKKIVDVEKPVDTDSLDSDRTNSPSQLSISTVDTSV